MIEVIAASGYDFVVIDTEHVAINDETLAHLIRAAEAAHIIPIVRVTAVIDRDIIKVLDMGAVLLCHTLKIVRQLSIL